MKFMEKIPSFIWFLTTHILYSMQTCFNVDSVSNKL